MVTPYLLGLGLGSGLGLASGLGSGLGLGVGVAYCVQSSTSLARSASGIVVPVGLFPVGMQ